MHPIIQFLKKLSEESSAPENSNSLPISYKRLGDLNRLFSKLPQAGSPPLKAVPGVKKGQIWLARDSYIDYMGNQVTARNPTLVLIASDIHYLDEEEYCRIQPISPYTHFLSSDDYLIEDPSIVGFPFLVETWNEQPVLIEVLDYLVGHMAVHDQYPQSEDVNNTPDQEAFRELEVQGTAYLRQSVLSYLRFLEVKQAADGGVVISLGGNAWMPPLLVNGEGKTEPEIALAAKAGMNKEDKYIEWTTEIDAQAIKVQLRKRETAYVLSVYPAKDYRLVNQRGSPLQGSKTADRTVFKGLEKGAYNLQISNHNITIRVK